MGAVSFERTSQGKTLREAYKKAHEDAIEEMGHQEGYSGDIDSTYSVLDKTEEFKRSKKSIKDFMEESFEVIPKRSCWAICLIEPILNSNRVKTKVDNIVTTGTKKWILKYKVVDRAGDTLFSKNTKGEAIQKAREYVEKHQCTLSVHLSKELSEGDTKVATVSYKRDATERDGTWIFFGVAPY